jgi:hypothetical protein
VTKQRLQLQDKETDHHTNTRKRSKSIGMKSWNTKDDVCATLKLKNPPKPDETKYEYQTKPRRNNIAIPEKKKVKLKFY